MALSPIFAGLTRLSYSQKLWTAASAGLAAHGCLFTHGEWHLRAPDVVAGHLLLYTLVLAANLKYSGDETPAVLGETAKMFAVYCVALFASMTLYRVVFHRLSRAGFRGPFLARVSKLWHTWSCLESRNYLVLAGLHERFGDFVRTGPNEVTVFHPEVFRTVEGYGSNCSKPDWYDMMHPAKSLVSSRDKKSHDPRRRVWDKGFSVKALEQYEPRTLHYVDKLESCICAAATAGIPVNAYNLFYWFGFDVMGDFIFAKDFGMLATEEWHVIVVKLRRALSLLGPLSSVPWLAHIAFRFIPGIWVVKDWFAMMKWCHAQMDERVKMEKDRADVAQWLISAAKKNGFSVEEQHWLRGDAVNAIVAGSDTTTSTLVGLFYRLAKNPDQAEKLYKEVATVDVRDAKALQSLKHLDGVINETLRLHPAVPTAGLRKSPLEGINIGGVYIPGNVTIATPRYTIFRREDCFSKANDFIPERWYSEPELVKNKHAFAPFAIGRFNCIGKNFARNELRFVTARLVQKYKISFPADFDPACVVNDLTDTFTANPGQLRLCFAPRLEDEGEEVGGLRHSSH